MTFNAGLRMAESYYAATAAAPPRRPQLEGDISADLCVIGGGCTGLAAALFAAKSGYQVALLEAGRIGWGASGRNGGQIIPGLRQGPAALLRRFGAEPARRIFQLAVSARDLVVGLIGEHAIACDLSLSGHLHCAARTSELDGLRREADLAARQFDYPHLTFLSKEDLRGELASTLYQGGLLDDRGGHFHPLNYALGLARAAESCGVRLYENARVISLPATGPVRVRTETGSVTAPAVIMACDALLGRLDPQLAGRIMPIASHIVTTAPLPDDMPLIPRHRAISDSFFSVNYFRMTRDRRLLFGGGERYWPGDAPDIEALLRPSLRRVFPQLKDVAFAHGWGGLVSITRSRLPDIGRKGPIFYAQGYSGQGAILSSLAGRLLAEACMGVTERFDLFSRLAPSAFPGGTSLRTPLHVLAMMWYALQDRLG